MDDLFLFCNIILNTRSCILLLCVVDLDKVKLNDDELMFAMIIEVHYSDSIPDCYQIGKTDNIHLTPGGDIDYPDQ